MASTKKSGARVGTRAMSAKNSNAGSKRRRYTLKDVPRSQIDLIVGNLHVGTPDEEVAADIRKRCEGSKMPAPVVTLAVKYAVERHQKNRGVYSDVMSGRIGRARRSKREDGHSSGRKKLTYTPDPYPHAPHSEPDTERSPTPFFERQKLTYTPPGHAPARKKLTYTPPGHASGKKRSWSSSSLPTRAPRTAINKEGLTYEEWLHAAGWRDVGPVLRDRKLIAAWKNREDPNEYRAMGAADRADVMSGHAGTLRRMNRENGFSVGSTDDGLYVVQAISHGRVVMSDSFDKRKDADACAREFLRFQAAEYETVRIITRDGELVSNHRVGDKRRKR